MKPHAIAAVLLWGAFAEAASLGQLQYSRDVRPILADKCFACHGPDEANRAADLRLDVRDAAIEQLRQGVHAITPGDAAASELVARINTSDAALRMPPVDSGKSLTPEEQATLARWIDAGAPYQDHWAFVAPVRPTLPVAPAGAVVDTPIDAFIVAGLAELGCGQAPVADRRKLIRRAYLDIIGLPPTPDEVAEFLADKREDAYERVVDRLLDSPRYGEHMARQWLDAARYGDTHGLHLDNYREMWRYRDWVIEAFNQNLSWDEFVVKQLAGDLLPNPTLDDIIATGFNRCHVSTSEGGSIDAEVEVRNVVDRVSTTGSVFLGLTMGCAVCHDHKYDPISQQDFYASYAFFNSIDGPAMDQNARDTAPSIFAPTRAQSAAIERLRGEIRELEQRLLRDDEVLEQEQRDWAESLRESGDAPPVTASVWSEVGPFFGPMRYLTSQDFGPEGAAVDLSADYDARRAKRAAWRPHPEWIDGRVHEDLAGRVALNYLHREVTAAEPTKVVARFRVRGGFAVLLNGKRIHNTLKKEGALDSPPVEVSLDLKEGANELLVKLVTPGGDEGSDRTAAFVLEWADDARVGALPSGVAAALAVTESERTPEQRLAVRRHYRLAVSQDVGLQRTVEQMREVANQLAQLRSDIPTTLVMRETDQPKPAYVLLRGQYDAPDEQRGPLSRTVPGFLPPLPAGAPANRLGYAQWLISPEHPLHARVTVNRLWQQFFGIGIVETADDFGIQGAYPSHPELLDWLAVEFRESGWDLRHMIRMIVLSRTYRQSSDARPEAAQADPGNRLLARGPRRRLDAEVIRDQSLAISGQLVHELGGPSVKPPQPDGLWKAVAYTGSNTNLFKADSSPRAGRRRSLYTFWKRTAPPPQMTILDAPSRESCTVRRERTNTPLQALLLMNEDQFVEAARALAERCLAEQPRDAAPQTVAAELFELATLRPPTSDESATLVGLYERSHERYAADPEAASELVATGTTPRRAEVNAEVVAAWTLVANTVLNLDEVLVNE
ncbi:Planctomycete cytochrome C [Posidoniimonas polymericola]|uniref:Planctomycete cytochrome C n=1 Tax=Posidoniimonas polymericola TaxID=2528002 RepID=A0A5C5YQ67_9BACT|nr:PSD1 and planctomycete cytochrome C domain-containing protein [Posidoniimonas polymericola]TWT77046.1 Planctomycete cytochrome C [Posidoniimonas polymericola]